MRSRVVVTNRAPSGLNRGFGGPQLYSALERTMYIAARRLGIDPAELARRNLVRAGADALPRRGRAPSTTPATTQRLPRRARSSWRATTTCAPSRRAARAEGRLLGIGLACVVEPSVSNMGYITLAQSAEERAAGAAQERQRRGRRRSRWARTAASRCASRPRRRARATAPSPRRSRPTCSASTPEQIDVRTDADTAANPWTVSSGNYSSRFAAMGASAVHLAATRLADRLRALAAPLLGCAPEDVELADGVGARARRRGAQRVAAPPGRRGALAPERSHGRGRRGARADRHLHAADLAARRRRPRQLVGLLRLHRRRVRRRDRPGDGRGRGALVRHGARRRAACSTRCWPTARSAAASPTASARRCSRSTATTRTATS